MCKRGYELYQGICLTSSQLIKIEKGETSVDTINTQRGVKSNGFDGSFGFGGGFDNFNGNFGMPQTTFGSSSSTNNLVTTDTTPKPISVLVLPPNCKESDQSNPQLCKVCLPLFTIDNGICKPQNQPSGIITLSTRDPNCARYNSSVCLECSFRYYFTPSGSCAPVNPMCK